MGLQESNLHNDNSDIATIMCLLFQLYLQTVLLKVVMNIGNKVNYLSVEMRQVLVSSM